MARSANPTVTIVVPARNEARNLEVVLPELPDVAQIVLVDGNSADETIETAHRVRPGITVVSQTRTGKGNALACGFEVAKGDIVVMFDADGSADPREIPAFIAALTAGADFAKGTRFCGAGGSDDITPLRRAGNRLLNLLTNTLFRTSFSDLCYGYNAFWRDIVPLLDLPPSLDGERGNSMRWGDGFEIETVLNCRVAAAGLSISEVPSVERQRIFGTSNLRTFSDGFRVLRTIVTEWRRHRAARPAVVRRPAVITGRALLDEAA
jgi:glycosyltransferase involved in cell wall biosynthesis